MLEMSHLKGTLEDSRQFQNALSVLITNVPFLIDIEIYLQVPSYPLLENVSIDLWLDCYAE
jgi:hypothetical protein